MGDRRASPAWAEIRSWAALGMAVVSVVGVLWGRRTGVVARFKNPITHQIVCQCFCMVSDESGSSAGGSQNFEERANCGTLNGISCEDAPGKLGKLEDCKKVSVPVELVRQRVQGERPLVK
jgi:hypothetical protein